MESVDALVCLAPGSLKVERRLAPKPGTGDALVRPRRIGICGTDYHIYEGKHPFLRYPRVMGHELAVEVVTAPPASGLKAGDACVVNPYLACGHCVACRAGKPNCCVTLSVLGVHQDGGMTGLLALPAGNLIPADGLSLDACATVEFLAIGAHAVRRAAVTAGDKVLVSGAGPIGLGVALFARLSGGEVALFDPDPERAEAARAVTGVTAFSASDDRDSALRDFTSGEGFSVVFDATGNARAMEGGFDAVANGGRYVLVSVVMDPITFMDPDFHRKEMTLLASRNATMADFERVISAIRENKVPVDRLITHRTSLSAAAADLPRWAGNKTGLVKALIELG